MTNLLITIGVTALGSCIYAQNVANLELEMFSAFMVMASMYGAYLNGDI